MGAYQMQWHQCSLLPLIGQQSPPGVGVSLAEDEDRTRTAVGRVRANPADGGAIHGTWLSW
jgi:hypothetical protein